MEVFIPGTATDHCDKLPYCFSPPPTRSWDQLLSQWVEGIGFRVYWQRP